MPRVSWDHWAARVGDRKSTRLNSSHLGISYAVFCLKKKKLGDWAHSWMDQASNGGDCERCSKCGKTRANAHNWIGCRFCFFLKIRAHHHHSPFPRLAT